MAQVETGNFPIPNDTGANVLADINENITAKDSSILSSFIFRFPPFGLSGY